jgi:hypothetical protein
MMRPFIGIEGHTMRKIMAKGNKLQVGSAIIIHSHLQLNILE